MVTREKEIVIKLKLETASMYRTSSEDATGQKASGELPLHFKHSVAPALGWYVPAGHAEHGRWPVLENIPGSHSTTIIRIEQITKVLCNC